MEMVLQAKVRISNCTYIVFCVRLTENVLKISLFFYFVSTIESLYILYNI